MIFNYRAIDRKGVVIEGKTESLSEKEASHKLKKIGLNVVEITRPSDFTLWVEGLKEKIGMDKLNLDRKERIEFYKELQSLIKVGLSPLESIKYMSSPTADSMNQKTAAQTVMQKMQEGEQFANAMKITGFPSSVCEALWVGEATGSLQRAIAAVIRQEELQKKLSEGIMGIYLSPLLMGSLMIAAFVASVIFMVPIQLQVIGSLVDTVDDYPPMSAAVFWFGEWGIITVVAILGTAFTLFFGLKIALHFHEGLRFKWDEVKLGFPVFGSFYKYQEYARITNLLGIALGKTKKQSIVTSMLKNQVESPVMKYKMGRIHDLVENKGYTLSQSMTEVEFNQLIATFVKRGEQSGLSEVSSILEDITHHFEYKAMHHLEVLKSASEVTNMIILIILSTPVLLISVGPSLDQVTLMMSKV